MDGIRGNLDGVRNIIRFNWHLYVLPLVLVSLFFLFRSYVNFIAQLLFGSILVLTICFTLISLWVSWYIYDRSDLYKFTWLEEIGMANNDAILNIHAGFDETSVVLKNKLNNAEFLIMDFYDPLKHTEVSIKRARKAYPPNPNVQAINTSSIPVADNSADKVFTILSAHEIRDRNERIIFFKEIERALNTSGQVIVIEHLRDAANFVAYNIGFLHFHSRASWLETFSAAGLLLTKEIKITPFITTFILEKNGAAN